MRGLQSSVVADPTKKSASYVPAQPALLFALKSTDVARGMFPGGTILANPIVKGFVNPRHQGYVTGPNRLPRVVVDLGGADYNPTPTGTFASVTYSFADQAGVPPGSEFEVALTNGLNTENIQYIYINDTLTRGILSPVTITTNPLWSGSSFVSDPDAPYIYNATVNSFPGLSTILTFRNVPVVTGLTLEFNEAP